VPKQKTPPPTSEKPIANIGAPLRRLRVIPLERPIPDGPATLAERIVTARHAANLSQGRLAQRIGVSRGAVGQWETGATEPNDSNLRRVAIETGAPYEWLATGRGGGARFTPKQTLIFPIPLAGAVEAGVFRALEIEAKNPKDSPVMGDPRYAEVPQYAWEVRGDSMTLAGIDDGMYILTATADDFREKYGPVKVGSFVIVQRLRADGSERELSVKEYSIPRPLGDSRDGFELRPRSPNNAHKSYFISADTGEQLEGTQEIEIVGVVLAAIRLFNP
jgi:transcriptional regulator with XRE-family HTH domain